MKTGLLALLAAFMLVLPGCERREEPAEGLQEQTEEFGEDIEQGTEDVGEGFEEGTEDIGE